jgi:hypothetical protein
MRFSEQYIPVRGIALYWQPGRQRLWQLPSPTGRVALDSRLPDVI